MNTTTADSAAASPSPDLPVSAFERRFGHPPGLVVLFFAGMWERFAYFGARALLKLYMVNYLFVTLRQAVQGGSYVEVGNPDTVIGWGFIRHLLPALEPEQLQRCVAGAMPRLLEGNPSYHVMPLADAAAQSLAEQTCAAAPQASMIYGLYVGLVHLTPLLGGLLADRFLGQRRTMLGGGVLLATGYFAMAFDGSFFLALALVILGSGAFTPNVYAQVGGLYSRGDPRRDGGFTLFYLGINLGALFCNIVCGTLAVVVGWHASFVAAGVGMSIGLAISTLGQKYLSPLGLPTPGDKPASPPAKTATIVGLFVILCLLGAAFSALNEQQGNSLQAWADERAGSAWLLAVNPVAILVFAPLLDLFWRRQARTGTQPSSASKMAIGFFLLGLAFVAMMVGAKVLGAGQGSPLLPLFCTLLLTLGELYFLPISLSLVTKIFTVRGVSTMVALLLMSSLIGNALSGFLGVLAGTWSTAALFLILAVLAAGGGLAMLACRAPLKRAVASSV